MVASVQNKEVSDDGYQSASEFSRKAKRAHRQKERSNSPRKDKAQGEKNRGPRNDGAISDNDTDDHQGKGKQDNERMKMTTRKPSNVLITDFLTAELKTHKRINQVDGVSTELKFSGVPKERQATMDDDGSAKSAQLVSPKKHESLFSLLRSSSDEDDNELINRKQTCSK